jgi:PhzF family phenazine biosynthesis protein
MEAPVSAGQTAAALNLDGGNLDPAGPFGFVNAGLNTLLVGVATLSACIDCRPDYETLRRFCLEHGIDIVTIYSRETSCALNAFRTRVFAPAFGYLEDPATGSGNAALGHLMEASGLLPGERVRIEQGTSRESPNIIHLKKSGARFSIGGQSVCRIEGTYTLF